MPGDHAYAPRARSAWHPHQDPVRAGGDWTGAAIVAAARSTKEQDAFRLAQVLAGDPQRLAFCAGLLITGSASQLRDLRASLSRGAARPGFVRASRPNRHDSERDKNSATAIDDPNHETPLGDVLPTG